MNTTVIISSLYAAPKDGEPSQSNSRHTLTPSNEATSTSTVLPAEQSQDTGTVIPKLSQQPSASPQADTWTKSLQQSASCGSLVPYSTKALQSITCSQDALLSKLQWATRELASTSSVDQSIQLCQLIKACADALKSTRELLPPDIPP